MRRFLRHVDGLADRARQERLGRAHHLDVAHVVDRPHAARRLERAVEHRQVRVLDVRRPFDGLVLVDVLDDLLDLLRVVAQLAERHRHGLIDDLHQAAADQLLVLDQRDVGLDAGRVAVHHEPDGAGRRQHGRLGIAEAVLLAHLDDFVPQRPGRLHQLLGDVGLVDVLERRAVLPHHAQERLAVDLVAGERTAVIARDLRRLRVGGAVHDGGDGGGVVTAGVAVVRHAARHQQRAEIGVAEAEGTEVVAVPLDRLASGSSSCRPGSPAR